MIYERLTFRRGIIYGGQFAPGGRDVFYTAAWDSDDPEIFATLPRSRTSRPLGLSRAEVLSVSADGEIALLQKSTSNRWENPAFDTSGTLALTSVSGGAVRDVAERAVMADWNPVGDDLAIVRRIDRLYRVELPAGEVLYETANLIDSIRFGPDGDVLAFGEKTAGYGTNWSIVFLDRDGDTTRFDTGIRGDVLDLAWSPNGQEVWFNSHQGGGPDLYAMPRSGESRILARLPIELRILDVAPDGRLLAARSNLRVGVAGVPPGGEGVERDFSWLDSTEIDGITGDGRTMVLTEWGDGGGEGWSVYLRSSDGSPAVRLGEGQAFDLSPDGKWALAMRRGPPASLVLLPTGAGAPIEIQNDSIADFATAQFIVDESAIVFAGAERDAPVRWYLQSMPDGEPRPVTENIAYFQGFELGSSPVSPDGKWLAAARDGVIALHPLDGGEPRVLENVPDSMEVIRFSAEGRFLYVQEQSGRIAQRVHRVDLGTGRRELWKEIVPADPAGLHDIYALQISDDGESYYYSYFRKFSDLYLIEGLR